MSGGVSAVDAAAGQIDDDVASIDLALPAAERRSVPRNHAPWPGGGAAAQDDDVITVSVKRPGKNRPDLAGSSWNDDLHRSPLFDESTAVFRTRHQALVEAAEHAISVSSDDVVQAVQDRRGNHAQQDGRFPRPPELPGDEQRGATAAEQPRAIGPKVRHHIERGQFVGIAAEALHRRPPGRALERGEREDGAAILHEEELEQPIAQPAHAVVQHEVGAVAARGALRR